MAIFLGGPSLPGSLSLYYRCAIASNPFAYAEFKVLLSLSTVSHPPRIRTVSDYETLVVASAASHASPDQEQRFLSHSIFVLVFSLKSCHLLIPKSSSRAASLWELRDGDGVEPAVLHHILASLHYFYAIQCTCTRIG